MIDVMHVIKSLIDTCIESLQNVSNTVLNNTKCQSILSPSDSYRYIIELLLTLK